jgi:TPR repeat protein
MTGDWSNEDIWLNAIAAFPDVKPLVDLLRSNLHMPPGARDLLAEMLMPGDPPIEKFQLECKPNPDFETVLWKLSVEAKYHMNKAAGLGSEEAAEQTGDPSAGVRKVGVRQVLRVVKEQTKRRLHQRLKRQDGQS